MAGKTGRPAAAKAAAREVTADPNVIPFIDVMLVLLIIFMIAAPISTVDIEVDMPTSRIQPSQRPPRADLDFASTEGRSGREVYVMNDEVPMGELGEKTLEAVEHELTATSPNDRIRDSWTSASTSAPTRIRPIAMSCG